MTHVAEELTTFSQNEGRPIVERSRTGALPLWKAERQK